MGGRAGRGWVRARLRMGWQAAAHGVRDFPRMDEQEPAHGLALRTGARFAAHG
jgi:hypothetical protein